MSLRILFLALLLLTFAAPIAAAQCTIDNEQLCDLAQTARFDDVFGEYADIALIAIGLFATALLLVLLTWLLAKLRPNGMLRLDVGEKMREVEPGSTARFKVEVENVNRRYPVDVYVERPEIPSGWSQDVSAAILLPSGFRVPQALGAASTFSLSSETRGANRAVIQVSVTAPAETKVEESMDYELRTIPVFRGKIRKGRARKTQLTTLVTPHLPHVQIYKVAHEPERIMAGQPVLTRAFLANKGEKDAAEVAVRFTLNGQEIDRKIVPAIATQAEAQVEFHWTPQAGENKIRVAVDA
jgi:hypothetical protein